MQRNIRLLSAFNFLLEFSFYGPIAIIYFSQVAGSYALGASILGLAQLTSAVFELPTGVWSDRVGRRRTIIAGSWVRLLSVVLYALGFNYWWLVAGAVLEGLSRSLYSGNNDAFLHDTLDDEGKKDSYDKHLGHTMSFEHLAIGLGALVGSIIADISFTYLMWLSTLPQLVKLVVSYQFTEPRSRVQVNANIFSHTKDAINLFVKNSNLRLLSLSSILQESIGEVSFQFRSTFFAGIWPLWAIGAVHTVTQFGAAISYYFSDKVIKWLGHHRLLLIRSIIGKASGLLAYGFPSVYSPLIVTLPSVFYGAGQVARNSLMQREFTNHQRATMSSLNALAGSVGFGIMSILVGLFADNTSPALALLILTFLSLPTIPIYYKLFKAR